MNPNAPIRDIMTTLLTTVSPEEPAEKIYNIFKKESFHHLPVVDKGQNLVGIISKEDFFKNYQTVLSGDIHEKGRAEKGNSELTARDLMTQWPMHLDPEDSIGLAADIFLSNKFHSLPVVEDDQLIGLITSHDLLAYSFSAPTEDSNMQEFRES